MNESSAVDKATTESCIQLHLQYSHGWGSLATYFTGLRSGLLRARRCVVCERLWIPPRRVCCCGSLQMAWEDHSGKGIVQAVTQGTARPPGVRDPLQRVWVLVRFDQAIGAALAVDASPVEVRVGEEVRIVACGEDAGSTPVLTVQRLSSGGVGSQEPQ